MTLIQYQFNIKFHLSTLVRGENLTQIQIEEGKEIK